MAAILGAKIVVLVVSGAHKNAILRRTLTDLESDHVPASHLRRAARLIVLTDAAAGAGLSSP
jgi:6-phosphogluconolactonase/glucosamine-6-phosphate isomerase/deaminase